MGSPFDRFGNILFATLSNFFGEDAEILYKVGPGLQPSQQVRGIFISASEALGEPMVVSDFSSTFEIKQGDYTQPSKGDGLKVRGEIYKIAEIQRNSSGVLKLFLKKEARLKRVKKN